jgi:hypothetical protein
MGRTTKKKKQQEPKDPHLDIPSVANDEKHINFLAEEEKSRQPVARIDTQNEEDEKRKQRWRDAIEAAKRERGEE